MRRTALWAVAVCCLGWIVWKPALLGVMPGVLLLVAPGSHRIDRGSLLVHILASSLAFWVAAFWFLSWIPVSLTALFDATCVGGVLALVGIGFSGRALPRGGGGGRDLALAAGLFGVVLAARLAPMAFAITPAGADMSMHAYITELIVRADGIPPGYRPILAIDGFDTFSVGFHTLSALVALLGDLPAHRSTFVVAGLAHALLSFSLFALLRGYVSRTAALLGALLFTFFLKSPQSMVSWGGNPTVLALAFAAWLPAAWLGVRQGRAEGVVLSALAGAAILLTHTIVFVQASYLVGIPFLVVALLRRPWSPRQVALHAWLGASFLVFAAPYLARVDPAIATPEVRLWIRSWVRDAPHAWHGDLADALWSIPRYVVQQFGDRALVFLPWIAVGVGALYRRSRPDLWCTLGFAGVGCLLILNTHYWLLPLSWAIYPERTAAMLVIPLSLLLGMGIDGSAGPLLRSRSRVAARGWVAVSLALAAGMAVLVILVRAVDRSYGDRYFSRILQKNAVTQADLRAIRWLEANSREGELVANNYGDAGLWIPAIAFRPVTSAHVNVAHLYQSRRAPGAPRYAFVGEKCVYDCELSAESLDSDPRWRLRHSDGDARIYEAVPYR